MLPSGLIPSLESRLYTSAVSPVAGLTADRPMLEQIQDAKMMMTYLSGMEMG